MPTSMITYIPYHIYIYVGGRNKSQARCQGAWGKERGRIICTYVRRQLFWLEFWWHRPVLNFFVRLRPLLAFFLLLTFSTFWQVFYQLLLSMLF